MGATLVPPMLDLDTIGALEAVLPQAKLHALLLLFVKDAEEILASIDRSIAGDDLGSLSRDAHALVGSAGNMGALQVSKLARNLEHACRAPDRKAEDRSCTCLPPGTGAGPFYLPASGRLCWRIDVSPR